MLVFLIEAALRLEDVATLRRLRPMLAEFAGMNLVAGQFVAVFGSADRYLGAVDSLLGEADRGGLVPRRRGDGRPDGCTAASGGDDGPARPAPPTPRRRGRREAEELENRARALAEPLGLARVLGLLPATTRSGPSDGPERPDGLTAREIEVLTLLAEGLINREIAERLVISENTAANHVRSILTKTGSSNRTRAAIYAAERGLL